ncbi:sugar ABC transporter ATP-binding protein [Amycolatopsis alkalitolerans]|nr:sugar ABC transporter ATP-binding protein [Amycolatopsis alkalitolerans]
MESIPTTAPQPPTTRVAPVVEARSLSKRFGATKAVSDGSFHLAPGEVVALLGENGSGKSTLVKLLSGVLRPDGGEILVAGEPTRLRSPRAALDAGIVTVFQEILCARDCSVLDNLWLGNGSAVRSRAALRRRRELATRAWTALAGRPAGLDQPAGALSLMQQQICVIVRALLREPKLLVLDESTSTLDVTLQQRLFGELRRRTGEGMACLFISHRMDEVLTVADRFVALRSGEVVGTRGRGETDGRELIRLISGQEAATPPRLERAASPGEVAVELTGVRLRPASAPFGARIRAGEVVGLAGLEGHGQDELIKAIAGLHRVREGEIRVHGSGVRGYRRAVARGVVYVPRDRKVEGMADVLGVLDNYGLPTLRRDQRLGLVRPGRTRKRFRQDARTVNFVPGRQESIGRLSGGNQQKVIIARWLAAAPRVILLNDPARGVDQKTKHELYQVFRDLAAQGAAVVMLSSEVGELVHLMDRVLVFHDGSLSAELAGADLTGEALVSAYFGAGGRSVS